MKNLHLLPTDKPSKIYKCFGKLSIGDYNTTREGLRVTNQHTYITNDEEIKEGDWYFYMNQVMRRFRKNHKAEYPYPEYQKIILTDDISLVKEGVQRINDDFLEWLVNNPTCEYIEIERDSREVGGHNGGVQIEYGQYEIILP
jgi:hypothetical protein